MVCFLCVKKSCALSRTVIIAFFEWKVNVRIVNEYGKDKKKALYLSALYQRYFVSGAYIPSRVDLVIDKIRFLLYN